MGHTTSPTVALERATIARVALGVVLFGAGVAVFAAEPAWMPSVTAGGAALVGAGVAIVVTNLWNARKRATEDIRVDERVQSIGEKAGYRSYQITVMLEGLLLAIVGLTDLAVDALSVLGVLFATTTFVYLGSYLWLSRQM